LKGTSISLKGLIKKKLGEWMGLGEGKTTSVARSRNLGSGASGLPWFFP
jgi:hypothetical protein